MANNLLLKKRIRFFAELRPLNDRKILKLSCL